MDDPTFLRMLAVVQVMPGSNGVNLTVLVGQHLRGATGAATALLGLLAALFAIVLAIGALYFRVGEHAAVQAMLNGVAAIVIGLTFATGLGSLARGTTSAASWPSLPSQCCASACCVGRSCRSLWDWRRSASAFACCRGIGDRMRDGPGEVLLALVLVFAPLSLLALGGGTSVIADIAQQSIAVHNWTSEREFSDPLARARRWPR